MAVQNSIALRTARMDQNAVVIGASPTLRIKTGPQPADCAAARQGNMLCEATLPASWLQAAATGKVDGANLPWDLGVGQNGGGTAGHYEIDQGGTIHEQGSVSGLGGGGDMELSSATIAEDQPVSITNYSATDGNA